MHQLAFVEMEFARSVLGRFRIVRDHHDGLALTTIQSLQQIHGKGFVLVRKKGKLPPPVVELAYGLEYGQGVLEMQAGSGRLLLVDDVLATGGTLTASAALAELAGYSVLQSIVLVDLKLDPPFRWGRSPVRAALEY